MLFDIIICFFNKKTSQKEFAFLWKNGIVIEILKENSLYVQLVSITTTNRHPDKGLPKTTLFCGTFF